MMPGSLLLLGLLFLPLQQAASGNLASIRQIEIESHAYGLRWSSSLHVVIRKDGEIFRCDDNVVDANLVESLSKALAEPANPRPEAGDLGITGDWLKNDESIYSRKEILSDPAPTPGEEKSFERSLSNPTTLGADLDQLYSSRHTDDNPEVKIQVSFDDGTSMSVSSWSQHAFMLPWAIDRDGKRQTAYNADISRAVAALMPEGSANRSRIEGKQLAHELAFSVMGPIQHEDLVKQLKADTQHAEDALRPLHPTHNVFFPEIRRNDHPDRWATPTASYPGQPGDSTSQRAMQFFKSEQSAGPGETDIYASLGMDRFPGNFTEDLTLHYQNERAQGVEIFLRRSRRLEDTVFAVPWLSKFIRANPQIIFRVSYVYDTSVTNAALQAFATDMRGMGKEELARALEANRDRSVLFLTGRGSGEGVWVVLPDKRVILWRHAGSASESSVSPDLALWKSADFTFKTCASAWNRSCIGAEIEPDGHLKEK